VREVYARLLEYRAIHEDTGDPASAGMVLPGVLAKPGRTSPAMFEFLQRVADTGLQSLEIGYRLATQFIEVDTRHLLRAGLRRCFLDYVH
jgi:hypothetical protein